MLMYLQQPALCNGGRIPLRPLFTARFLGMAEFDRGYTRSQNAHRLQELKAREEARREEQESAMGTGIHEISGPKRDESNVSGNTMPHIHCVVKKIVLGVFFFSLSGAF